MKTSHSAHAHPDVAGPVTTKEHPSVDKTVTLTAMHATFTIQSVHDWLERDAQRLEDGTPDTLAYLTESTRFLMSVTDYNAKFAGICREQLQIKNFLIEGILKTGETLKSINFDMTKMEESVNGLRLQAAQLEAGAGSHEATVEQLSGLFERLQERLDTLMRAPGTISGRSRPN